MGRSVDVVRYDVNVTPERRPMAFPIKSVYQINSLTIILFSIARMVIALCLGILQT